MVVWKKQLLRLAISSVRTAERLSDERGNAEKVKFTMYINAGDGPGASSVEDIVWTWESEFDSATIQPMVARVLGLMVPGGNLSVWAGTYRSITRDPRDLEDIRDWTWKRFCDELCDSTMYSPPDNKKLLEAFDKAKCQEPGTQDQVTAYTNLYMQSFQDLRRHRLDTHFSAPQLAQRYYNNLTKLVKHHMVLRDPQRKHSEIREDLKDRRRT